MASKLQTIIGRYGTQAKTKLRNAALTVPDVWRKKLVGDPAGSSPLFPTAD